MAIQLDLLHVLLKEATVVVLLILFVGGICRDYISSVFLLEC